MRALRNLRRRRGWRRDIAAWRASGSLLPPPHALKAQAVWRYGRGLRTLVETGTYHGAMIIAVRPGFERVVSIELHDELYESARERFSHDPHVTIRHGDSAAVLPAVVSELEAPAVFWLDGHYSGEGTAQSENPVLHELRAILADSANHVVLVDDAIDLDVPALQSLTGELRPDHAFVVRDNVIRIHARERARRHAPKAGPALSSSQIGR